MLLVRRPRALRAALLALPLLFLAACDDDCGATCLTGQYAPLQVVNADTLYDGIQVVVDNAVVKRNVPSGTGSGIIQLATTAANELRVIPFSAHSVDQLSTNISATANEPQLAVIYSLPDSALGYYVAEEAGPTPTDGLARVRVVDAWTGHAAVDVVVTPPGAGATPVTFPALAEQDETPFAAGAAGTWSVKVTPAGVPGTTLATATVDLLANQRASFVLLRAYHATTPTLVAVRER